MIYEHFNMRLHADDGSLDAPTLDASSWEIRAGDGELDAFTVGSIVNPKPTAKKNLLDINGMSGSLDLSEDNGRIFFESKTVTVILQGRADFNDMDEIEEFLSPYQGRLMDFTTDNYLNVSGYQVGRMTAEISRKNNRVTITFENVDPYRYSDLETRKTLTVLANYERDVNTATWTLGSIAGGGGELAVANDVNGGFVYYDSAAGAVFKRIKTVSGNNGKYLALGIVSIDGGDVWFEWTENGKTIKSRTTAKVVDGAITMKCSIDGSYYEWRTVDGVRKYVPTIRCSYVLSNFLPMSGNELSDDVSMKIPSNVIIRPLVTTSYAAGYIICDGVCVAVNKSPFFRTIPRLAIAGDRADLENRLATSVFVVIPKVAGGQPQTIFWFREAEVF